MGLKFQKAGLNATNATIPAMMRNLSVHGEADHMTVKKSEFEKPRKPLNPRVKDLLHIGFIILASILLVVGVLMAYEEWNVVLGVVIVVIAWILISMVRMLVKSEART